MGGTPPLRRCGTWYMHMHMKKIAVMAAKTPMNVGLEYSFRISSLGMGSRQWSPNAVEREAPMMTSRSLPTPRPTFSFLKKRGATTWTRMQVNETPNGKMSEADAKARDRMSSGVGKMRGEEPCKPLDDHRCQTPCAAPRRASPRTPCRRASSARSQTRTRTPRGWCRAGRRARSKTRRRRPPTPTRSAQTWWWR